MQYAVKELMFLVEKYNLKFTEQTFKSTPFGNWVTKTYSFYNDSGCFTISELLQRDEIDFYFSDVFSTAYPDLKQRHIGHITIRFLISTLPIFHGVNNALNLGSMFSIRYRFLP